MKKVLALLMCSIFLVSFTAFGATNDTELTWEDRIREAAVEQAVDKLEKLDLVHKPKERWRREDFITRRDAFSLVYMIKSYTKEYYPEDEEELKKYMDRLIAVCVENSRKTERPFWDVKEDSEDAYLLISLIIYRLINGNCENMSYSYAEDGNMFFCEQGKWNEGDYPTANFNSYATYEEALTMIGRLFNDYSRTHRFNEFPKQEEHPYYVYAEQLGLINCKNEMQVSAPIIKEEQLNDYISAWEFMNLLHRAMYVPFSFIADYANEDNYHYIDRFIGMDPKEAYYVNNHEKSISL